MKTKLMALLMLVLLAVPGALAEGTVDYADDASNYEVTNIGINGQNYDNLVYVERGSDLQVEVYLEGHDLDLDGDGVNDIEVADENYYEEDVNIRVWIGGYEYDDVSVTSDIFDVEAGVSYKHRLYLPLPEDMEAEQVYTVYVEVYDDVDAEIWTAEIMLSRERHLLAFQDILVDDAEAGDYVTTTVRLENMGDNKEEDILVELFVDDLGIETATYLDELTSDEIDNEDEEDSGDVSLTFQVPEDAAEGDYEVRVVVTYDRGTETIEDATSFYVSTSEAVDEGASDDSSVTVDVTDDEDSGADDSEEDDFSTALKLGFGILAVLIVILALILIVRR